MCCQSQCIISKFDQSGLDPHQNVMGSSFTKNKKVQNPFPGDSPSDIKLSALHKYSAAMKTLN